MNRKEISSKPKIILLGLITIVLLVTIQEYTFTYGQTNVNQTNDNQTYVNQSSSASSEEEFEEGEEIGEEDTL